MEAELVKRAQVSFQAIPAAGVHGVGARALPGNLIQLGRGVLVSRRILREFKPDVLLFTGGYVAVPMAMAGRGIPTFLYVPDIEPGLALRVLARFADRIALTAPDSNAYFPGNEKTIVTGYPTRRDLARWNRETGRQALGLDPTRPVLLVFGGSKGARSLNRALLAILSDILQLAQVVHVCGPLDWEEVELAHSALSPDQAASYHPFPYLHEEMGAALASADLAVSRAGASTLGELPLFGLPAILVPYPFAWRYQIVNARYLADHGAALVLEDSRLSSDLFPTLRSLLSRPERLAAMGKAMSALATPRAAELIASEVRVLAGKRKGERG